MSETHNPYAPPAAAVADQPDPTPLERPPGVRRAVQLLWVATFIGFAFTVYTLAHDALVEDYGDGAMAVYVGMGIALVVTLAVSYWIFTAIWNGRHWARVTLLVIAILNILSTLALPLMMKSMGIPRATMTPVEVVSYLVQVALTACAIILVFSPSARPWFARRR